MTMSAIAALLACLVFWGAMIGACIMDLLTMKIRNWLVVALLLAYWVLAPFAGFDLATIGWSAAAAGAVLLVAFAFFAMGWIGGGDAKLAAVTALWVGSGQTLNYVFYTALLGGVLSIILMSFRELELPHRWRASPWLARLHGPGTNIPYGVAMAPAALLVFPNTAWMAAF